MASLQKWAVYLCLFAVGIYFLKQWSAGRQCDTPVRIDGKVVIITGANTGIGKETARDLAVRGGKVYMACRSLERCEKAAQDISQTSNVDRNNLLVMNLDLSSYSSIRDFAHQFKAVESRLDILVNNAGVFWLTHGLTEDGVETVFGVNHLGHFLLTNLLVEHLIISAPSRVVSVSSIAHETATLDFDDLMNEKDYEMFNVYGRSKLANVLFSAELGRKLNGTGVTKYSLHPGFIRTDVGRNMPIVNLPVIREILYVLSWPFVRSAEEGAQTQICCAVDPSLEKITGKYYNDCRETSPSEAATSREDSKRLWRVSLALAKLLPEETHPLLQ